jgi:cellulose synthase/poly-beta-1,6-N-acetylglucosamine synthase-like glycosyltransferase
MIFSLPGCLLIYVFFIFFSHRLHSYIVTRKKQPIQPTTLVVPAYLCNELSVLEKSFASYIRVKGLHHIILTWNGPLPEDSSILMRLQEMKTPDIEIDIYHVSGSHSKAENINAVLPLIKDEFLMICDADDILYPDALETLFRGMGDNVWCVQGTFRIRYAGNWLVWTSDLVEHSLTHLSSIVSRFSVFMGHSALLKTSVLRQTKFYEKCINEDIELSIACQKFGHIRTVGFTSECLAPPSYSSYLYQRYQWWKGGIQLSHYSSVRSLMLTMYILIYILVAEPWATLVFASFFTATLTETLVSVIGLYFFVFNIHILTVITFLKMFLHGNDNKRDLVREPTPRTKPSGGNKIKTETAIK